jgi:hypothetical protein
LLGAEWSKITGPASDERNKSNLFRAEWGKTSNSFEVKWDQKLLGAEWASKTAKDESKLRPSEQLLCSEWGRDTALLQDTKARGEGNEF